MTTEYKGLETLVLQALEPQAQWSIDTPLSPLSTLELTPENVISSLEPTPKNVTKPKSCKSTQGRRKIRKLKRKKKHVNFQGKAKILT